jgi:hypothetical protein
MEPEVTFANPQNGDSFGFASQIFDDKLALKSIHSATVASVHICFVFKTTDSQLAKMIGLGL